MIQAQDAFRAGLSKYLGLERYVEIVRYRSTDVTRDKKFQTLFNGYYNIRLSEKQLRGFYKTFQDARVARKPPSYETLLRSLHEATGRVEASFASKILATIDCSKPIVDRRVLDALDAQGLLKAPSYSGNTELRLQQAALFYQKLKQTLGEILASRDGKRCIKEFDVMFPAYAWISDMKKLDFMLWMSA